MISRRHFWRLGAGLLAATGLKAKAEPAKPAYEQYTGIACVKVYFSLFEDGKVGCSGLSWRDPTMTHAFPHEDDAKLTDYQKQTLAKQVEELANFISEKTLRLERV